MIFGCLLDTVFDERLLLVAEISLSVSQPPLRFGERFAAKHYVGLENASLPNVKQRLQSPTPKKKFPVSCEPVPEAWPRAKQSLMRHF